MVCPGASRDTPYVWRASTAATRRGSAHSTTDRMPMAAPVASSTDAEGALHIGDGSCRTSHRSGPPSRSRSWLRTPGRPAPVREKVLRPILSSGCVIAVCACAVLTCAVLTRAVLARAIGSAVLAVADGLVKGCSGHGGAPWCVAGRARKCAPRPKRGWRSRYLSRHSIILM